MKSSKRLVLAAMFGMAGANCYQPVAIAQMTDSSVALREVDIRAFIEDVANVTGRTFIIDPRVAGKVTVIASRALSPNELFEVFLSTLRANGFMPRPPARIHTASSRMKLLHANPPPRALACRTTAMSHKCFS
jgi:general secretion pathway protein D